MAERNRNKDFQEKVKKDEGRFQAYFFNNLELLDPANQLAGRPRKLTTLKSTTDLTNGRIANQLSLTDHFRVYSTVPLRALYPGFYPGPMGAIVRLTATGTYRTVTVPDGARFMRVFMWGSGGEPAPSGSTGVIGGGGAYVEGYLPVTTNEVLRIIVGNRSGGDVNGGGGAGGGSGWAGGGRTAVQRLNGGTYEDIVVAGGGGGGGGGYPAGNLMTGGAATASGISFAGRSEDLRTPVRQTAANGQNGGGGGPSSGGISPAGAGSNGTKGAGGPGNSNYTGGGGGGWYGGAGGQQSPPNHGSGGGGSSYPNLLVNFTGSDGDGATGGNPGSALRINTAGDAGFDGLFYYQFYVNI